MWSYVGKKAPPRWLWWVEDVATGQVVSFVFGRRTHATFERLRQQLAQADLAVGLWITDGWWAYVDRRPGGWKTNRSSSAWSAST